MCEDAACAEAEYGSVVAKALIGRLADLRAAGHPLEVPFAEARTAAGDDPEHVKIGLVTGRFLVIGANHLTPPRTLSGAIAWERVNRIIILRVE